jgi:tetratricopeptide (TPR) repeat protein
LTDILSALLQSFALYQRGRFQDAIGLAKSVLSRDPRNVDALNVLALSHLSLKNLAEATRSIEAALAIKADRPDSLNSHGLILRAQSQTAAAKAQFRKAIEVDPTYKMGHCNLANCYRDLGRLEEALAHFNAALRIDKDFMPALNNRGIVLCRLNRPGDALADFDRIIALKPDFAEVHYNRGDALRALKRDAEAVVSYSRAIALMPRLAEAHCNRGNALRALKRFEEALGDYDTALRLKPDFAEAHLSRSVVLGDLGRLDEALASVDHAIARQPSYPEALVNRGNILRRLDRPGDALSDFDTAIRLKPDWADAHASKGNALKDLVRLQESLACYDEAIRLSPTLAEAHGNKGIVLTDLGDLDAALASLDKAIELQPGYADAYCSKGLVLKYLNRLDAALASFGRAVELDPDSWEAKANISYLLLQRRSFAEGFGSFSSRWLIGGKEEPPFDPSIPKWDGRPFDGNLFLWAEQGLGDEIFFASMLSLFSSDTMRVTLAADRRLHEIYRRSFPAFHLIDRKASALEGHFDAQAPIGDLGHLLKIDDEMIARRRYPFLLPNPDRSRRFRERLAIAGSGLVCGISWRSANRKVGRDRSIRLEDLVGAFDGQSASFVNLQYGDVSEEIANVGIQSGTRIQEMSDLDLFQDIDGLLALIDACDVVLTIDNVTAHLAGAIGKAAAVLVPSGKGQIWYWHGESVSRWYPSLRIFYQERIGDWANTIHAAATWVRERKAS